MEFRDKIFFDGLFLFSIYVLPIDMDNDIDVRLIIILLMELFKGIFMEILKSINNNMFKNLTI